MNEEFVRGVLNEIIKERVKKESGKRTIGIYFPSEIPFCMRRNFYLYNIQKDLKFGTLLLFESGSMYHRWFNELFENSPLVENHINEKEVWMSLDGGSIVIKGRLDDFVYFKLKKILGQWKPASDTNLPSACQGEGERQDKMKYDNLSLIEVKSVRNITYINSPKTHHAMQFMFYLKKFNMQKGFLIYVDRRDLSFKIFEINYDEKIFSELVRRARQLHGFLMSDSLPRPEAKEDKNQAWQCGICNFREECSKGQNPRNNKPLDSDGEVKR